MLHRAAQVLQTLSKRVGLGQDWYLIILGALIGVVTGLGAVGFAETLHFIEKLCNNARDAGPLWLIPALPMLGALITGLIVYFFASDARGHGVPQVMKAIVQNNGDMPLRTGVVKTIASISTVGTGGSSGTEGPIVQIGSVAASFLARRMGVLREHRPTMVGCGAAAGIASVFNAPIAGVFFVLEILLRDFSLKVFTPIVIAAVCSAALTQQFHGANVAIFAVRDVEGVQYSGVGLTALPSFVLLGCICGVVAVGFNRLLHTSEDAYDRLGLHPVIKPVTGAFALGLLGIAWVLLLGNVAPGTEAAEAKTPAFFGGGYDTIRALINPQTYTGGSDLVLPVLWLLALLVFVKAIATVFTLASGGSGGVFAPSLFLGAATGAAVGVALERIGLLPAEGSPAAYAIVGMAAVVAGSTHAPLTAILILFELTRDEQLLVPTMLAAVIATVVSQLIDKDSVYTAKLRQAGLLLGSTRDLLVLRRIPLSSVRVTPLPPEPVYASDPLSKLITLHAHHHVPDFIVVDQAGHYLGVVTGQDIRTALIDREAIPLLLVAELMRTDVPTLKPSEGLDAVLRKFAQHDVASLPLVGDDTGTAANPHSPSPIGLITRRDLMHRYQEIIAEEQR